MEKEIEIEIIIPEGTLNVNQTARMRTRPRNLICFRQPNIRPERNTVIVSGLQGSTSSENNGMHPASGIHVSGSPEYESSGSHFPCPKCRSQMRVVECRDVHTPSEHHGSHFPCPKCRSSMRVVEYRDVPTESGMDISGLENQRHFPCPKCMSPMRVFECRLNTTVPVECIIIDDDDDDE